MKSNQVILLATLLTPIILLQSEQSIAGIGWVYSNGQYCPQVCASKGQGVNAVWHGYHAGNMSQPINVCAANARDSRPGINVIPFQGVCIYPYGSGQSEEVSGYWCLCYN